MAASVIVGAGGFEPPKRSSWLNHAPWNPTMRPRLDVLLFGERDDPFAAEAGSVHGRRVVDRHGWYIAGLVDGEGCFSIGKAKCSFIIKLRDDDRPLLEWVQKQLGGVGLVSQACGALGNRNPQAQLVIARKAELLWLTEFFDVFELRGKKARDYAIWREAVIEWANGMSPSALIDYKTRLAETRAYA